MFTKNTVKYDANWEITNTYENLQIVWSQSISKYSFIFGLIWISIGLSVFGFVANKYKRRAIQLHLTICNIQSAIWWAIMKVITIHHYLVLSQGNQLTLAQTPTAIKVVLSKVGHFARVH
jgi:hypothetical protein